MGAVVDALLHCARRDQPVHMYGLGLPDAMRASNSLKVDLREQKERLTHFRF